MEDITKLWDGSSLSPTVKKMFELSKQELDPQSIFMKPIEEELIDEQFDDRAKRTY